MGSVEYSHRISDYEDLPDLLDRSRIAQAILADIVSGKRSRLIGIYGSWGAGKSYLMSQIRGLIEQQDFADLKLIPCVFEAWRYEFEGDLAPGLIRTLMDVSELDSFKLDIEKQKAFKRDLQDIGNVILDIISAVIPGVYGKILTRIGTRSLNNEHNEPTPETTYKVEQLHEKMCELEACITSAAKQAIGREISVRVVVFIDDLDRCSPRNLVRMFEWLKVHLLTEHFSYVIGLDHVAAARAIYGHYKNFIDKKESIAYGFRYLEKLIDSEYELQPSDLVEMMAVRQVYEIPDCRLRQYICGPRGAHLGDFPGFDLIDRLLEMKSIRNPRTMLKILNKFRRIFEGFQHIGSNGCSLGNDKHLIELRNHLGLAYPFWILFITTMYYRLDPDYLSEFIRGRGRLYECLTVDEDGTRGTTIKSSKTELEFIVFADEFKRNKTIRVPKASDLQELASIISANTV
jgi:hypothetical protein